MGGFGREAGRADLFERVGAILCFHEIHGGLCAGQSLLWGGGLQTKDRLCGGVWVCRFMHY